MKNSAGVVLLVIGLIFGPGYYVYSRFFSGKVVSTFPLTMKHQAADNHFAPLQLELAPDMGKIGLILRFQTGHGPVATPVQMPHNEYRAILRANNQTILDKAFTLSSSSVESEVMLNFSEALPVFRVEAHGIYQLEISQTGDTGMNLISADVQVRKDVVQSNDTLLTMGVGLLAVGVAVLLL